MVTRLKVCCTVHDLLGHWNIEWWIVNRCESYGYVTHKPKAAIYLVAHSYQWKADLLIYKIGTRWSIDKNMIDSQSIDREIIDI